MSKVSVSVDISDAKDELDRIDGLGLSTLLKLEGVLTAQFQSTQRAVHIYTGKLAASGKVNSDLRDDTWTGEVSYGGFAPGYAGRVEYAEVEQARAPGGSLWHQERGWLPGRNRADNYNVWHDFMAPAHAYELAYLEVIDNFVEGIDR